MTAFAFDTHEFFNELKQAGFSEQQAESITRLQRRSADATIDYLRHEHDLDKLVTVKELDARITETELKMELVRAELKRDISETKAELIRWVVGVGILQVAVITALMLKVISHA